MTYPTGSEFMEKTKYQNLSDPPQRLGEPQPPLELPIKDETALIALPGFDQLDISESNLIKLLEQRKSVRKYSDQALSLEELSYLLWSTQGVKEVTSRPVTLRPVPSAGARHAFETYILVNKVQGLDTGVYRYIASKHALLPVNLSVDIAGKLTEACLKQKMVKTSAVTFFWSAIVERMTWRYVERGYRYLHLDAGHVCQNLYLAGESIDCGTCAIAAYDDDLVNNCLSLDGEEQLVIYIATTGKKI